MESASHIKRPTRRSRSARSSLFPCRKILVAVRCKVSRFLFCSFCVLGKPCILTPRRGWSDAPAEWVQIVRGPRPKSVKWPMARGQSSGTRPASAMARGRRGSQDGAPRQEAERGLPPDEVLANARARVSKLEAAIAAVGESDPISATLKEALSRAKSQAQERPVADRIKHTNIFIERAKKGSCRSSKR